MKKSIFLTNKANFLRNRINSISYALDTMLEIGKNNSLDLSLDDLLSNKGSASRMKLKNRLTENLPNANDFEISRQQREQAEREAYEFLASFDKSLNRLRENLQGLTVVDFFELKEGKILKKEKDIESFIKKACTHTLSDEENDLNDLIDRLVIAKKKGFNAEHYCHNGREFANCFEGYLDRLYNRTFL